MKVLFSDTTYSYILPGGKQVLVEKLYQELNKLNTEVIYENWHDPKLKGDLVHFFGFNDFHKIITLKNKGYKLVYTHILDGLTNLSASQKLYHKIKNEMINVLPGKFDSMFPWRGLKYFDAIVYLNQGDRDTAIKLYNVDPAKAHVISHGIDSIDKFKGGVADKNPKFLVSLGSIVERKNHVFTASICRKNKIPVKFIGHRFDEQAPYYKEFLQQIDNETTEYFGFLSEDEKIDMMKRASGFVLLSHGESGCISVYEAGACGLPLLLSDLPWAKGYENPNHLSFCSPVNVSDAEKQLLDFYKNAERKNEPTFEIHTWSEIASRLKSLYQTILKN
jgi:glycosyltransferase involved in cell wall biosynthesis